MGVVYLGHDPSSTAGRHQGLPARGCRGQRQEPDPHPVSHEARRPGLDHRTSCASTRRASWTVKPYIVMEYVPGGETLRRYCEAGERPRSTGGAAGRQCARRARLCPPERGDAPGREGPPTSCSRPRGVKLADFGVALRAHPDAAEPLGAYGSPRYVSPEQARGDPPRALGPVLPRVASTSCSPDSAVLGGDPQHPALQSALRGPDRDRDTAFDLPVGVSEIGAARPREGSGAAASPRVRRWPAPRRCARRGGEATGPASPEQPAQALVGLRFFRTSPSRR